MDLRIRVGDVGKNVEGDDTVAVLDEEGKCTCLVSQTCGRHLCWIDVDQGTKLWAGEGLVRTSPTKGDV